MVEQSITSQTSHPNQSSQSPPVSIMLATNMAKLFNGFRPTNNPIQLNDANENPLFQSLKTENKQQLCRRLTQQWEAFAQDQNSNSPIAPLQASPLMASPVQCNRNSLGCNQSPPSDTTRSPGLQNGHQNNDSPNSTKFATTSIIINALSSNPALVGSQLLPACSPLLQLAIRQALSECLPNLGNLNIQGSLEVSADFPNPQQQDSVRTTAVLQFEDCGRVHSSSTASSPINTQSNFRQDFRRESVTSNCSNNSTQERQSIFCGNDQTPISQTNGNNVGSSRRKSVNPIKLKSDDYPKVEPSMQSIFSSMPSINPFIVSGRMSGPTSPSTDSGILDLSRNGSIAGSAPITPMKDLNLMDETIKSAEHHQILQACQKQLSVLSHIQMAMNRSTYPSMTSFDYHNLLIPPMNLGSAGRTNSVQSTPNSPIKVPGVRKQRAVNRASTLGRMCSIRRPNSSRRFHCNQCREEFTSLHLLEEHTTTKHGSYRCHICKAQFTQRSNLQRHALKHVGFKPFECRVCAKAYYRKDHLMRHMEMSHPGFIPRDNITVHLTSSESLEFLNRTCTDQFPNDSMTAEYNKEFLNANCSDQSHSEQLKTILDQKPTMMEVEMNNDSNFHENNFSIENDLAQPTSNPSASDSSPYHEDLIVDEEQSDRRDSDYSLNELTVSEAVEGVHLQSDQQTNSPPMSCSI